MPRRCGVGSNWKRSDAGPKVSQPAGYGGFALAGAERSRVVSCDRSGLGFRRPYSRAALSSRSAQAPLHRGSAGASRPLGRNEFPQILGEQGSRPGHDRLAALSASPSPPLWRGDYALPPVPRVTAAGTKRCSTNPFAIAARSGRAGFGSTSAGGRARSARGSRRLATIWEFRPAPR